MKINKVVTSVNDNPDYIGLWEPFYKSWTEKTGIRPHLFYVGDSLDSFQMFEEISGKGTVTQLTKEREWIGGMAEPWITAWATFWGISTFDKETVCLTANIDQLALSDSVQEDVFDIPDSAYVALLRRGDWRAEPGERRNLSAGYNCAKAGLFQYVMRFEDTWEAEIDKHDKLDLFLEWMPNDRGFNKWGLDETYITEALQRYEKKEGGTVLTPVGHHHIDHWRINAHQCKTRIYDEINIRAGLFYECHCPKPYDKYSAEIDELIEIAPNK